MVLSTRWCGVLASAAMLALVAGCATQRSPAAQQARLRTLRSELLARDDPDALAAAAMFERLATGQWRDAPELAARAAAAAPERKDLAFLQLSLCYQLPACEPKPFEDHLRQLDPANGISWIFALGAATRTNDVAGVHAARDGLDQAQRVDLYWTALVSHMTAALTGKAGFDQGGAFVQVVGVAAAMVLPPLQPLSRYCSRLAIADADVLARCRRMAAALEHADTILFESYGNDLAARLWPEGSAEGIAVASERHGLDYRIDLGRAQEKALNSQKATKSLAALYPRYTSEQAAMRAWYAGLGLNPDPPG